MSTENPNRNFLAQLRHYVAIVLAGGSWSTQLPGVVQSNLRWYSSDGLFASSQDAIVVTYLTIYILALGATTTEIGLMSSLASLVATFLLVPGAIIGERARQRKWVVLSGGGGITRLAILFYALVPFILKGHSAVIAIIALKVIADGAANFSLPAWTALTGEIIPMAWRGRYFGTRNTIIGVATMGITLLAGELITRVGVPMGYQVVFGVAFVLGAVASFSFAHLQEPPDHEPNPAALAAYTPSALIKTLRDDRNFVYFCVSMMLWNLALGIAGPFFSVYMVSRLGATAAIVGLLNIVSSIASLPAQRFFGQLNDRLGARRVMIICGLLIPIMPVSWIFTSSPWHIVPINIGSGILWAGFNLASFNFLLSISTPENRARYSALFQIVVMLTSAIGAALGGFMVTHWGYNIVFILSGAGRFAAILLFWKLVHGEDGNSPVRAAGLPAD